MLNTTKWIIEHVIEPRDGANKKPAYLIKCPYCNYQLITTEDAHFYYCPYCGESMRCDDVHKD